VLDASCMREGVPGMLELNLNFPYQEQRNREQVASQKPQQLKIPHTEMTAFRQVLLSITASQPRGNVIVMTEYF